jgi:predicted nucleic acid-binding protein
MVFLTSYIMNETTNSSVCVDASLIIRTLIPGRFSDEAETLLATWLHENIQLRAPSLLAFEVTSALRRLVAAEAITPTRGDEAHAEFLRIPIRLSSRRAIFPLAWRFAKQLNRPRAYDTAYLALARITNSPFWTADERLYNAVNGSLSWVRWVGSVIEH